VYPRWVSNLPNWLPRQGFEIIQAGNTKFQQDLVSLCTNTYLMALAEILRGIERNSAADVAISVRKHDEALHGLCRSLGTGWFIIGFRLLCWAERKNSRDSVAEKKQHGS
jgi:hypothetical protein